MIDNSQRSPVSFTYSLQDTAVINMFDNMLDRYNTTITTTGGIKFNQGTIVTMIVAYLMSTYTTSQPAGIRFFNEMRKVKETFERKTHIKFS